MSHSFTKIWIHAIWATKERALLVKPAVETILYPYLHQQFRALGCTVRIINGMPDHVHCLFQQNPQKSVADIVKQVKGSSSHYINSQDLIQGKFAWQTGYAAYSVSESVLEKVHRYIQRQKEHHARRSFPDEFEGLLHLHELSQDAGSENG